MNDEVRHNIETLSDDELVDLLSQPHDYTQFALEVARETLRSRGKEDLLQGISEPQPSQPIVMTKRRMPLLGALSVKKGSRLAFFRLYLITFLIPYLLTLAMGGEPARDFPMIGAFVSHNTTTGKAFGYSLLGSLAAFGVVSKSYIPYAFFLAVTGFDVFIWLMVGWSFRNM